MFAHRDQRRYERNYKFSWHDNTEQHIRCYCCSIQWCDEVLTYIFRCSKDPSQHQMAKSIVYTILNGGVEEVTQRLGRSTV